MKLNPIFSSHMVFAQGHPIRIYGEGCGRANIFFAGQNRKVVSDGEEWFVEFESMEYGGPYELKVDFCDRSIVLDDIFIGEVFLFAGQSNMQFKLGESLTPKALYETNDRLRMFFTDRIEKTDMFTAADGWVKSNKDTVEHWSAIAYLAANRLSKTHGVAVGVITCYQGASTIESWVPKGAFSEIGIKIDNKYKFQDHTIEEYSAWNGEGVLYSFALSQVTPFSLSAVVWYQGESDTSIHEGEVYADELGRLINIWRSDFKNDKLPFVIIQIADYIERDDEGWKLVQAAQEKIQFMIPGVKTVVSADVCENYEVHPQTKAGIAERVADTLQEMLNISI
ncbi:MAG: sialate O-acetylesterase [bacterium]|nr:sialate O-acetylesterase [bacterium]